MAIISHKVNSDDDEKFLNAWNRANGFLSNQRGFISNTLHQAASANARFRFVNVARWEDEDCFRAATLSGAFLEESNLLAPYPVRAAVYEVVRT